MTYVPDAKNGFCTISETYDEILLPTGTVHIKPVGWMWVHWIPGQSEIKGAYVNSFEDAQAKAQAEARRINTVYVSHFSDIPLGPRE